MQKRWSVALVEDRLVEHRHHALGTVLPQRRGAQRVAHQRGQRGGVRALAADVADRQAPGRPVGAEDVVEVAADDHPVAGRAVARVDVEALDLRQSLRQQAALERLGDLALEPVDLGVADRGRGDLRELDEDRLGARVGVLGAEDLDLADDEAAAAGEAGAQRAGRVAGVLGRRLAGGGGERAARLRARQLEVGAGRAAAEHVARLGGDEVDHVGDRQRGVERDRDLGDRLQLARVLVLQPRDLLDLEVAAVGDLEGRQALAQEGGGALGQLRAAAPGRARAGRPRRPPRDAPPPAPAATGARRRPRG